MSVQRVYRKVERSPEELVRLRADRERYQREKPTPDELRARGDEFGPLGQLLLLHRLTAELRRERERQGLTLAGLAGRTGIDEAALSRLETGRHGNPTVDTLYRVAAALGKEIYCSL